MKDNVNNYFGVAPDKGFLTGPVLGPLNASTLAHIHGHSNASSHHSNKRQDTGDPFWLADLGSMGQMPLAPTGYQYFRNVVSIEREGIVPTGLNCEKC
jgi:glucan 1,3-beta-glucosidase